MQSVHTHLWVRPSKVSWLDCWIQYWGGLFFLGAIGMYEGICFKCSIISLQLPIFFKLIFCPVWNYTLITYIIFWNRYRSGIAFCVQHLCKCFRPELMILIYNCGWRFYNCLCRICQEVCWLFSTFSLLVSAYCSELICEGIRYSPSRTSITLHACFVCNCLLYTSLKFLGITRK